MGAGAGAPAVAEEGGGGKAGWRGDRRRRAVVNVVVSNRADVEVVMHSLHSMVAREKS